MLHPAIVEKGDKDRQSFHSLLVTHHAISGTRKAAGAAHWPRLSADGMQRFFEYLDKIVNPRGKRAIVPELGPLAPVARTIRD
jgi:hypothetical protein